MCFPLFQMASALKGTTAAMAKMNKKMNLPAMNKIMAEFQREEMKAEMTMEIMGDTMDEAMEGENDEEEESAIISQILDEIGIDASQLVPDAPQIAPTKMGAAVEAEPQQPVAAAADGGGGVDIDPAVSDLEERLNNLRRN